MIEAPRALRPACLALLLAACDGGGPTLVIETGGGDVEVAVEVADAPEERQRGLMGREALPEGAGMVFLHRRPEASSFWMKDTLIPLSLAVWGEDGRVAAVLDMEPCRADPCPIYDPGVAWVGALEVNRGFFEEHGVEVGDALRLES